MLGLDAHVVGRLVVERLEHVVRQRVAEAPLDLLPHALGPAVVDHELHPRLDPREPVAQVFLPGVEQRPHHRHRFVLANPDAEVTGDPRNRRQPTADEHRETTFAVPDRADE